MKHCSSYFSMAGLQLIYQGGITRSLVLALAISAAIAGNPAEVGKGFATPEDAVTALVAAASTDDSKTLGEIFGPAVADLVNPDRVQATNEHKAFVSAFDQAHRIIHESDSRCVLEIGDTAWPFPIPILKQSGQWFFDTEAGKVELINRRIGRNELATLQTVRAYAEAQREYATKDRDGDEVLEYAQMLRSGDGKKDGLYWPPELDGEISPLGPLAAQAQDEGYGWKSKTEGAAPEPFHGYLFKILTRQSKAAPGGKYDYLINGNMIGGFALVAWPAEYGESGIMTFVVNQQGRVYQKDLGLKTARIAGAMKEYGPDKTWTLSHD